ncbi:hypothetical protein ZIOFF_062573 [Zingiber officinale]|uniref:Uncharacterized protein n=1 Tax=Zingiber officinale TaxID=94328 RepID=A0A8J5KJC8_ZINOF|nr:hypothetical protein ZIOFF_062573 [Zingiber officinale]
MPACTKRFRGFITSEATRTRSVSSAAFSLAIAEEAPKATAAAVSSSVSDLFELLSEFLSSSISISIS